ncbi:hypothetical protein [Candidatus Liberibacter sp.]|uniref:hypothetical protein n=1 Tax=Candidatus Liberibacter sp. TaxID=34022 RepID=UPI0015F40587|nr:hypothetical protein [Candidatus Liberibacter sp.]MBA5724364.1 hypothetical protein [Candidatus Liberibacter sp.]
MTLKKSALAFILLSSSVMLNGCDFFNPERHRTTKIDLISIVKQIQSSTAKNPLDKSTEQPLLPEKNIPSSGSTEQPQPPEKNIPASGGTEQPQPPEKNIPASGSTEQPQTISEFYHQDFHRIQENDMTFEHAFNREPQSIEDYSPNNPLNPNVFLNLTDQQQKDALQNITFENYRKLLPLLLYGYRDSYQEFNKINKDRSTNNNPTLINQLIESQEKTNKAERAYYNLIKTRDPKYTWQISIKKVLP